jgi:phosphoserine phosphatase RsbU/P
MIPIAVVVFVSLVYLGLLFAVAFYADRQRRAGRSLVSNPHVYALSLAVYFTSWTFYGSAGRAATVGLDFMPTDLAPTLMAFTWWFLLRKIVRISKEQNITSIADFISSRYGKATSLGAIVTIFTVVGIMPYIALQLKAVAHTFDLLTRHPAAAAGAAAIPGFHPQFDYAFYVALILGVFGVLFGARRLVAAERHEGLVAAIAVEAVVKLAAFLAVGLFVTYGLFDGMGDIYARFAASFPERMDLLRLGTEQIPHSSWFTLIVLSMLAFMVLPRQFHIMVIENSDEDHIRSAMWRFPAYSFLINVFVIPIALGGLLYTGGDTAGADFFVLHLPLQTGHPWLALLVFVGGFSAAAGMVMVSSVTLATMILNHLLMPLLLRFEFGRMAGLLLNLKRLAIFGVIFLGYAYYRLFGESYALVNIGLVSFVAAAQFAPAFFGGLYWKRANLKGAVTGLTLGFVVWFYTLMIPSFVRSGWLPETILQHGPWGIELLRPLQLFGLTGLDPWGQALFWTLLVNGGAFLTLSLLTRANAGEREQAAKFVEVFSPGAQERGLQRISKAPTVMEFVELMAKFIGDQPARAAIAGYLGDVDIDARGSLSEFELPDLKRFAERTLAGSVGAAPARVIVDSYLATRGSTMEDVFDIFGSVTISRRAGREQLGVLHEVTRIVASGADLDRILERILELFRQQFKFDLCIIRLLDEERRVLRVRQQQGMSWEHLEESERALDEETYVGEAFVTNRVVAVNDTDLLDKEAPAAIIRREGICSFAHAPITVEGEPIGVLSAFSRSAKGIFTEEFTDLFRSLAGQVGVAWRNARQTEKLIRAREKERELEIARAIQSSLLPARVPQLAGLSLAATCIPAREVGGDYYDFLPRGADRLDLLIADVSGHNVGAALIMTEARTFIRSHFEMLATPQQTTTALNRFLYEDLSRAELFISCFYLSYRPRSRRLRFANAGHNLPLLWRSETAGLERLDAEGLILGVRPEVAFEERELQLNAGDVLLLYTDGITEAENAGGEFFGEERLAALLAELHGASPAGTVEAILAAVHGFAGTESLNDDATLVVMRVDET